MHRQRLFPSGIHHQAEADFKKAPGQWWGINSECVGFVSDRSSSSNVSVTWSLCGQMLIVKMSMWPVNAEVARRMTLKVNGGLGVRKHQCKQLASNACRKSGFRQWLGDLLHVKWLHSLQNNKWRWRLAPPRLYSRKPFIWLVISPWDSQDFRTMSTGLPWGSVPNDVCGSTTVTSYLKEYVGTLHSCSYI